MKLFDGIDPFFIPKKRLGQNFLVDQRVISRLVAVCGLDPGETILEIGPGQGALTRLLAPCVRKVIAVEADRVLASRLEEEFTGRNVEVHREDILKFDLSRLGSAPVKVVGNVPYNISTPIIAMVVEQRAAFSSLFMTVQYEFGARLVARPGTRDYSSLTCFVQMFTVPVMLFKISPAAFRPAPKVMSCFMRFDMRDKPAEDIVDEALFVRVVRQAFQQRRKNVLNSLAALCSKEKTHGILEQAGVRPESRAGDLTVGDYARIANAYTAQDLLS